MVDPGIVLADWTINEQPVAAVYNTTVSDGSECTGRILTYFYRIMFSRGQRCGRVGTEVMRDFRDYSTQEPRDK